MRPLFVLFLSCLSFFQVGCNRSNDSSSPIADPSTYPQKTVTIICPWAAGGGTDRLSRFIASQLEKELGQPFIVVNKIGGSGAVGHSAGALAKPDGYTITMATFELSTMHWMGISDLTWENFEPVIQLNADAAAILVRNDSPWKSLSDMMNYIKTSPGKLIMSGTATGGAWDLARAGFMLVAQLPVSAVRWSPTKGSAPSIVELLGGHINAVCCSLPEAASQIEAGQLKALAVMAPERLKEYPEVPTVKESGVDWVAVGWRGLVMPKNTPASIINRINEACQKITGSEDFLAFMKKNGFAIEIRLANDFAGFLKKQDAQWKPVIEAAGYAKK
jgi:tripartite-type tricarboxylate transporter receptor subunit TctC